MIPPHVWMVEYGGHTHVHPEEDGQSLYSYFVNKYDLSRIMRVDMPPVRRGTGRGTLSYWLHQHQIFPPPSHSPAMLANTNAKNMGWRNGYGEDGRDNWRVHSPCRGRVFTPTPLLEANFRDDSSEDSFQSSASGSAKGAKRGYSSPVGSDCPDYHGIPLRHTTSLTQPGDSELGKRSYPGVFQRGRARKFIPRTHPPGIIPPERFLSHGNLVHVTETPPQLLSGSEGDSLSKSIWDMFMTKQQSVSTYKEKILLWKDLFLFLRSNFSKVGLYLVGSTMSGLGSNTSDVDMCLLVRYSEMDQRNEALLHLSHVAQFLRQCRFINSVELINAKVPILKLKSKQGLEVDLNCNNAVGIRNTHLLYCYARVDWRVRPLVLVVKLWAAHHDINDAKRMTVSSYSWALMVIHYLQSGMKPSVVPCLQEMFRNAFIALDINQIDMHEELPPVPSENTATLGELLLGFLQYYAEFDYAKYAVSVRMAAKLPIEECRRARSIKNDPHQWKYLCIEEPFDLTNTARSVYDYGTFERVRRVLKASYDRLKSTGKLETLFDRCFRPL